MALAHQSLDLLHSGPIRPDIAWIFPGQGSQEIGMGRDVYDAFPEAREVFERADAALGIPLTRMCFEGPDEDLRLTANQQPAILTVSIAYLFAARSRHELVDCIPAFVAGSSLGEYTALIAAGVCSFESGVRLVRERGRLMHAAGELNPGTLAAVIGLAETDLAAVCDETGAEITNLNGAGQIVIGGPRQAVAQAMDLAQARGAAKVVPLSVSGAFHSSLMRPAAEGLAVALEQAELQSASIPIIANTTATPIAAADEIRDELLHQLCHAVRWHHSIERMAQLNVTTFVEFGPGRVNAALIRRIAKGVKTESINSLQSLSGSPS
ncbi:MAG: ACP S-malonyltransferase [Dehalococcoidia bacterium]